MESQEQYYMTAVSNSMVTNTVISDVSQALSFVYHFASHFGSLEEDEIKEAEWMSLATEAAKTRVVVDRHGPRGAYMFRMPTGTMIAIHRGEADV